MEDLRNAFKTKFPDPGVLFDNEDIQRLHNDDRLANAFLLANDQNVESALQQVEKSFNFRKEMELNTLTDNSFPLELRQKGSVYYHNHDKQGNKILYFRIRDNKREPAIVAVVKQFVAYLIDTEHRRDPSQQLVMLFDMTGAGLSNFDPDLVRFIITCFDTYFPHFLAYLIVYDMPFILNAAWKLIRNWLSERAREKVIFAKRDAITQYIERDQLWLHMGGTDDYEFVYTSPDGANGGEDITENGGDWRTRSVTDSVLLSNASSSPPSDAPAVSSMPTGRRRPLVEVTPADHLHFTPPNFSHNVQLRNSQTTPVAFKVNTTCPDQFRVRPSAGLLPPHGRAEVAVTLKTETTGAPSALTSARFQILALAVAANCERSTALSLLKAAPRETLFELRLGCGRTGSQNSHTTKEEVTLSSLKQELIRMEHQQKTLLEKFDSIQHLLRIICVIGAILLLFEFFRFAFSMRSSRAAHSEF